MVKCVQIRGVLPRDACLERLQIPERLPNTTSEFLTKYLSKHHLSNDLRKTHLRLLSDLGALNTDASFSNSP